MLRTRLLTATAAVALFAAGSAFAQTAPTTAPAQDVPAPTQTAPASAPAEAAPTTATTQAAGETPAATNTVVDVLRANGQFTTLLTALDAAQLTDTLKTQPAISIFAPTDAAFAALSEADRTRLLDPANVNELRQLLLYHVVVADVNSSQIEGAKGGVETAASTQVQLDGTGDAIKVDAATVTTADVDASNGSIFIIDRVLNPAESLVATGDAEEATAPADEAAPEATPPVSGDVEATTPPADETMTGDDAAAAGTTTESPTPPSDSWSTTNTTAAPAPTAPVTTTASPTVPNPTDGQTDAEPEADTTAPTPRPQS